MQAVYRGPAVTTAPILRAELNTCLTIYSHITDRLSQRAVVLNLKLQRVR